MKLSGLIDLHSHILPGVDDGCTDIENALVTARQYVESGYSTVVVTPHNIHGTAWSIGPKKIQQFASILQQEITANQIPLKIQAGMEIAFSELFWTHFQLEEFLPLGESSAYLVEFPLRESGRKNIEIFLDGISIGAGSKFVVAHPERCIPFQEDFRNLQLLFDKGCLIQLNFGSILGWYGKKSQNTALSIIMNRMCHFIATDCHGHEKRKVPESSHFHELEELLGRKNVVTAVRDNPLRILENVDIFPVRLAKDRVETIVENNEQKNDAPGDNGGAIFSRMFNFFRRNTG